MLTIQSNLKIQDLETLSKTLIKPDIINFGLSKVGGGYTDEIADKVIAKLSNLGKDKTIVIINDITLQMADKLLEAGYKNIYLAFGGFDKDGTVSKDKTVYNIMKAVIENNIKEKLNAVSLEEIFNMKIDGIIANPPYGKVGANITKKIIDMVDFTEYVNLLPANDYKRNDSKDLFNYQSDMESINDGFADAAVTTHLAKIHKNKVNNMTLDEFERSQYIDRQLDKYFEENSKRKHYAIDMPKELHRVENPDICKIIFIAHRDINHKHFPYNREAQANFINLNLGNYEAVCDKFVMKSAKEKGEIYFLGNCYVFNSTAEKSNMSNFIYSTNGFRFISKLFTAMNVDGRQTIKNVMPKVDWTRPWTVEEILKDYGYTEDEITEVMEDLKNFKGMDD